MSRQVYTLIKPHCTPCLRYVCEKKEKSKHFVDWNTYTEINSNKIMPKQKINVINILLEGLLQFAVVYNI